MGADNGVVQMKLVQETVSDRACMCPSPKPIGEANPLMTKIVDAVRLKAGFVEGSDPLICRNVITMDNSPVVAAGSLITATSTIAVS